MWTWWGGRELCPLCPLWFGVRRHNTCAASNTRPTSLLPAVLPSALVTMARIVFAALFLALAIGGEWPGADRPTGTPPALRAAARAPLPSHHPS